MVNGNCGAQWSNLIVNCSLKNSFMIVHEHCTKTFSRCKVLWGCKPECLEFQPCCCKATFVEDYLWWFHRLMLILFLRKPSSGEAGKRPSRPSSAAQERPAVDKKKEPDARERRRKEMMQNQVDSAHIMLKLLQAPLWTVLTFVIFLYRNRCIRTIWRKFTSKDGSVNRYWP